MKIEGNPTTIKRPVTEVYEFLTNFNNFEQLMPEQITNWKSDNDSCSFTIQGMADISLKFGEKLPVTKVKLVPDGKVPFSFSLSVNLADKTDHTLVDVSVDADLNPMMAMMAKRPLQNLVNEMASNLSGAIG